jgi:hypothetical protein
VVKRTTIISPDSSRALHANLSLFTGQDDLGSKQSETGKLHVVLKANNGIAPRFSKYSGVLEWLNCTFLWVNLHCKSPGQYDNQFLDRGKEFVWFGGSRMTQGCRQVLFKS